MQSFDPSLLTRTKGRLVKSAIFGKISKILPAWLRHAIRASNALTAFNCPNILGRFHCNDDMLDSFSSKDIRDYLKSGLCALTNIEDSLATAGRSFSDVRSCLDIPCGYGRVLRWLQVRMDRSLITACDLNREGVDFCEREFGTNPLYSRQNLCELVFPNKYDLIWVGSLLTHLEVETAIAFLHVLMEPLLPSGLIVFTTHGESCLYTPGIAFFYSGMPIANSREELAELEDKLMLQFSLDRFCYAPYSRGGSYGNTIHHRSFIEELMGKQFSRQLRLVRFREQGWDGLQDVWTYQKH
jgi:SAM-dependent methyltransferase